METSAVDVLDNNDKASLLNQLKIDRREPVAERNLAPLWWGLVIVALLGAGGVAFLLLKPKAIPVSVAVATIVETGIGQAARGASTLDASGYIVARRQATVSSKATGRVEEVLIEEGQAVQKDEILARLDPSNAQITLSQSQAQLAQAVANQEAAQIALENAVPIYERNQKLISQNMISQLAFDTAKASYDAARMSLAIAESSVAVARASLAAAQQNFDDTIIRAPFSGVVTVKAAQTGETVSPISAGGGFTRTGICTIVDMDSLELEVDVSENFINRVRANQPASIRLNAYPDWEIPAKVIAVIPTADQAKATVKVRIGFTERDSRILPEMGARVSFLEETESQPVAMSADAVIIPHNAVQVNGDTGVVYLLNEDTVERRAVRLGAKTRDGQVILSGLRAGNKIAIGDFSLLKDKATIKIIQ